MAQIKGNKLCYWCLGCNQLETSIFNGVMRCNDFVPGAEDWQEKLRKELKEK